MCCREWSYAESGQRTATVAGLILVSAKPGFDESTPVCFPKVKQRMAQGARPMTSSKLPVDLPTLRSLIDLMRESGFTQSMLTKRVADRLEIPHPTVNSAVSRWLGGGVNAVRRGKTIAMYRELVTELESVVRELDWPIRDVRAFLGEDQPAEQKLIARTGGDVLGLLYAAGHYVDPNMSDYFHNHLESCYDLAERVNFPEQTDAVALAKSFEKNLSDYRKETYVGGHYLLDAHGAVRCSYTPNAVNQGENYINSLVGKVPKDSTGELREYTRMAVEEGLGYVSNVLRAVDRQDPRTGLGMPIIVIAHPILRGAPGHEERTGLIDFVLDTGNSDLKRWLNIMSDRLVSVLDSFLNRIDEADDQTNSNCPKSVMERFESYGIAIFDRSWALVEASDHVRDPIELGKHLASQAQDSKLPWFNSADDALFCCQPLSDEVKGFTAVVCANKPIKSYSFPTSRVK
jgi:hypothetical protein